MRRPGLYLLFLFLLGCAASGVVVDVADLSRASDLDRGALETGGIAVLGFVGDLPDMHVSAAQMSGELTHIVSQWLPKVPLRKPSTLHGEAFAEARARLASGSLALPFEALHTAAGTRYLLSAELRSNEVIHTSSRSDEDVNYCTTRAVRARYRLIDLEKQGVAFHAIVSKRGEDCNSNPRSEGGSILGGLIADMITDAVWGTYPKPVPALWVTRNAARDFASLLPGAQAPVQKP